MQHMSRTSGSGYRRRWLFHRFPGRLQSYYHIFLPLVPSSNRTSDFPRYGSPTTFPLRAVGSTLRAASSTSRKPAWKPYGLAAEPEAMRLSVTVVVELQQLTELVYSQSNPPQADCGPSGCPSIDHCISASEIFVAVRGQTH
jgi:hypothetical protein